jgi:hypothetical protein
MDADAGEVCGRIGMTTLRVCPFRVAQTRKILA